MASLIKELKGGVQYRDRRFEGDAEAYAHALATSRTVYVGNLAFDTREEQLYEVFSMVAPVDTVIMGLNQVSKTPCGFAFVLFFSHQAAQAAASFVTGTKLDNRYIRVDVDWGFREGRQFGRGKMGGQVRDEFRSNYDEGRGGNPMHQAYMEGMGGTGAHHHPGKRARPWQEQDGRPPPQQRRPPPPPHQRASRERLRSSDEMQHGDAGPEHDGNPAQGADNEDPGAAGHGPRPAPPPPPPPPPE